MELNLQAILNNTVRELREDQGVVDYPEDTVEKDKDVVRGAAEYRGAVETPGLFPNHGKTIVDASKDAHHMAGDYAGRAGGAIKDAAGNVADRVSEVSKPVIDYAVENPAVSLGIPGALMVGAGALALRRRQLAAKRA